MHRFQFLFALAVAPLLSSACYALDQRAVLSAIRKSDAAFNSSSFEARVITQGKPSNRVSSTLWNGKYRYQLAQADKSTPMIFLFDGEDEFTTIGNTVTISRVASYADSPTKRMIQLQPGACFVKGRGLSLLVSPQVSAVAGSPLISLRGRTPDGALIKAWLDPKQKFLARRIERYAKKDGKLIVLIETQGIQNAGLLPLFSSVKFPTVAALPPTRYEFSRCTFGQKPKGNFQFSIAKPALLVDARFGAPVAIQKKTLTPMTKADIFAITDKQNAKLGALKEQERAAENKQRNINLALTFGPLAAAAALLCWRKKRVSTTA